MQVPAWVNVAVLPLTVQTPVLSEVNVTGFPEPPPVAPTKVQLSLVTPAGTTSLMLAPLAALGPLLLTTMV